MATTFRLKRKTYSEVSIEEKTFARLNVNKRFFDSVKQARKLADASKKAAPAVTEKASAATKTVVQQPPKGSVLQLGDVFNYGTKPAATTGRTSPGSGFVAKRSQFDSLANKGTKADRIARLGDRWKNRGKQTGSVLATQPPSQVQPAVTQQSSGKKFTLGRVFRRNPKPTPDPALQNALNRRAQATAETAPEKAGGLRKIFRRKPKPTPDPALQHALERRGQSTGATQPKGKGRSIFARREKPVADPALKNAQERLNQAKEARLTAQQPIGGADPALQHAQERLNQGVTGRTGREVTHMKAEEARQLLPNARAEQQAVSQSAPVVQAPVSGPVQQPQIQQAPVVNHPAPANTSENIVLPRHFKGQKLAVAGLGGLGVYGTVKGVQAVKNNNEY